MNKKTHCHFSVVIENAWKSLLAILAFIVFNVLGNSKEGVGQDIENSGTSVTYIIIALVALLLLDIGFYVVAWLNTWVYFDEDSFVMESGIFTKKKMQLPLDKITTVDLNKNILGYALGTSRVKLDTGSLSEKTDKKSEISLIFKDKQAEEIRKYILKGKKGYSEETENNDYTVPPERPTARFTMGPREFIKYGITERKLVGIIAAAFVVFPNIESIVGSKIYEQWMNKALTTGQAFLSQAALIVVLLVILALIILANIISMFITAVKYYNFSVERFRDNIHVEYGLFTHRSYTFPLEKIQAVTLKQNMMRQFLGYNTIELICSGYGDEKNEKAILFPIAERSNLNIILNSLFPEFSHMPETEKAPKRSKRNFFFVPMLFTAAADIAILAVGIFCGAPLWILILAVVLLTVIVIMSRALSFRNAALGYDKSSVCAVYGGFMKTTVLLKMDSLQSVSCTSHYFQRRKKICTYKIDYYATKLSVIIKIPHMEDYHLRNIESVINF